MQGRVNTGSIMILKYGHVLGSSDFMIMFEMYGTWFEV